MASSLSLVRHSLRQNLRLGLRARAWRHFALCRGTPAHGALVLGLASFFTNIDYLVDVQTIRSHLMALHSAPRRTKIHLDLQMPRHGHVARKVAKQHRTAVRSESASAAASVVALVAHWRRTGLAGRFTPGPTPYARLGPGAVPSNVTVSILCGLDR